MPPPNTYTKEMADISSTMFEAAREMEEAADDIEDAVKSGQVEAENIRMRWRRYIPTAVMQSSTGV